MEPLAVSKLAKIQCVDHPELTSVKGEGHLRVQQSMNTCASALQMT